MIRAVDFTDTPAKESLLKIDSGRTAAIDPALELTRGLDGVMQGTPGSDTFHYLRIDAAPPIIRYNRHEERYQALNEGCAGRPTDPCGTEAEPININYNSVTFLYTDAGAGLKELAIYNEKLDGSLPLKAWNLSGYTFQPDMSLTDGKYVQTITDTLGTHPPRG